MYMFKDNVPNHKIEGFHSEWPLNATILCKVVIQSLYATLPKLIFQIVTLRKITCLVKSQKVFKNAYWGVHRLPNAQY